MKLLLFVVCLLFSVVTLYAAEKQLDEDCVVGTDTCVSDGECTGAQGKKKCTCKNPAVNVLSADKTECVKKVDAPCTENQDQCVEGATCKGGQCTCTDDKKTGDATKTKCVKKVDASCTENQDQCVEGATCKGGQCTCTDDKKTGDATKTKCAYKPFCPDQPEPQNNADCLKKVDVKCAKGDQCIPGAACVEDKCACDSDHVKKDNAKCEKKLGVKCGAKEECTADADCTGTVPDKKCTCADDANKTPNGDKTKCVLKPGKTCTKDKNKCVDHAECKESTCTCMDGYTKDSTGTTCKKSSAASAVASVLLVLAAFLASPWI